MTTASVSAAIAALSSTSIECICAGLRLAAACGLAMPALTSAATAALPPNVAPAVGVAFDDEEFSFDQPKSSGKSDSSSAAAAIFSRLVLRKIPDIAEKPAHGRALDVARATLAALAGEAPAENPLAAVVVLSMTLRSWPSSRDPGRQDCRERCEISAIARLPGDDSMRPLYPFWVTRSTRRSGSWTSMRASLRGL